MDRQGPLLQTLLHRLSECPPEFLAPPLKDASLPKPGSVDVAAIVADHFRDMGVKPDERGELGRLRNVLYNSDRHAGLIAVAIWLLHDDAFLHQPDLAPAMWTLLTTGLAELAKIVKPESFVTDPDRREELARVCLAGLGMRPADETVLQATDRLASLDSVERDRVVARTAQAEARARQVREMMAKRAAEEAAAKTTRE